VTTDTDETVDPAGKKTVTDVAVALVKYTDTPPTSTWVAHERLSPVTVTSTRPCRAGTGALTAVTTGAGSVSVAGAEATISGCTAADDPVDDERTAGRADPPSVPW
jgi:hypothetical protein